jgi:hypothetical protein
MRKFPKPCLICNALSLETLCPTHLAQVKQLHDIRRQQVKKATGQYSGDYRKRAKQIRDTAIVCHLCGEGARYNDPWEADHIDPANPMSELKAAHASCNRSRGNKPLP